MRGTAGRWRAVPAAGGITPACAGNSGGKWSIYRLAWGSPPRVRGTVVCFPDGQYPSRITPACAGNRPYKKYWNIEFQDHPRVCGEQITPSPKIPCRTGSPPRVRGTVCFPSWGEHQRRITPACAGNSDPPHRKKRDEKDHPRVCGEQPRWR